MEIIDKPKIPSRRERIMRLWRRGTAVAALGGIAVAGPNFDSGDVKLFDPGSALGEGLTAQETDYSIGDTNLHIVSWKDNTAVDEIREPVQLTDEMNGIVNGQSALYDTMEGYDPNYLQDSEGFDRWVNSRMFHPDVLRFAGIDDSGSLSAKELVNLAQVVVASNKEYDMEMREEFMRDYSQSDVLLDEYDDRTKMPIDQLAKTDERVQCEMYALLTKTVFDSIKRQYPEQLANTYVKTHEMTSMAHTVNIVSTVTAGDQVAVSVIDTTSSDENPGTDLTEIGIADIALGYSGDYQSSNNVSNKNDTVQALIENHTLSDDDLETLFFGHLGMVSIADGEYVVKGLEPEVSKKLSEMVISRGLVDLPGESDL